MAIVFDWETSGLPLKGNAPLDKQPHVIEFAGIKLDDMALAKGEYLEVERLEFLCKPPIAILDPVITNITGITMDKLPNTVLENPRYLSDKPPFKAFYGKLVDFFFGERVAYAHNITFDILMTDFELRRIEKVTKFPWPPEQVCTVEKSYSIKNHRLKLQELYLWLFGEEFEGAHEAMNDVQALAKCVVEMKKRELL